MDEQVVLVNEVELDALGRERRAADLDLAVYLLAEAAHLLGDAAAGEPRVPLDALERRREDHLRQATPELRELAARRA